MPAARDLNRRVWSSVLRAGGVAGADLLTKAWARLSLNTESVQLVPGLVLQVTENVRGPFGLGPLWLTTVASIVFLILLVRGSSRWWPQPQSDSRLATLDSRLAQAALGLAVGGGLANLGERLLSGHTTNLLTLGGLTAINLADLAILLGLLLLLRPLR